MRLRAERILDKLLDGLTSAKVALEKAHASKDLQALNDAHAFGSGVATGAYLLLRAERDREPPMSEVLSDLREGRDRLAAYYIDQQGIGGKRLGNTSVLELLQWAAKKQEELAQ